ncbi:hypothetical protein, partial [Helicobacter sp. 12S02634-8]|uniref:hypothetical protein n=1 Tax=Helicobacter sp. 12S02634-8 TaxID=1476199 RepID=UPI001C0F2CD0
DTEIIVFTIEHILSHQSQVVIDTVNRKIKQIIYEVRCELIGEFATKSDLEAAVAKLEQKLMDEISKIKIEMANIRTEIAEVRTELKQDIAELRVEMEKRFGKVENRIDKQGSRTIFMGAIILIVILLTNPQAIELFKQFKSIF